jgi:hypothetical protein
MGFRKKFPLAVIAVGLVVSIASPVASAGSHHPTGEYAPFAECPWSNGSVTDCLDFTITGGSLTLGAKTIDINNPLTLQGGLYETGSGWQFVGAENGVTLSKVAEPLTGGLNGLTAPGWWPPEVQEWFNELIGKGFTGVNATLELAVPASSIGISLENLLFEEGTALTLPLKIKLDNEILGNNCYIGSNKEPIHLNLTTGVSGKLKGAAGELTFNEEFTLATISGLRLVDGLFSVPAASGCGGIFAEYVNPFINSLFGLPSGSEENAAILEGMLEDANTEAVKAHDM